MAANIEELYDALRNASAKAKAGDAKAAADAKKLADAIQQIQDATAAAGIAGTVDRAKNYAPGMGEYALDRAKAGLAAGMASPGFVEELLTGGRTFDPERQYNPLQNYEEDTKKYKEQLGYQGLKPSSNMMEIAGNVPESLANPVSLTGPGGGLASRVAGQVIPALTSKFGEIAGRQYGPGWETAGALAGGLVGGYANTAGERGLKLAKTGAEAVKGLINMGTDGGLESVKRQAGLLAEQHIKSVLKAALDSNPNLKDEIIRLQAQANALGIDLPISSITKNPVIDAAIASMAVKDTAFRDKFTKQFDAAKTELEKHAAEAFGDPVKAKEIIESTLAQYAKESPELFNLLKAKQGALQANDVKAFAYSSPLAPKWTAMTAEERNTNRINLGKEDISPRSKPYWEAADKVGANPFVELNKNEVKNIYQAAGGVKAEQLFDSFPNVWEKINSKFAPKASETDPNLLEWKPASYADYRSLQSEISDQLRSLNPNSPTFAKDQANLSKLAKAVEAAGDASFPEELTSNLKNARRQYAYDSTLKDISESIFNDKGILDENKLEAWLKDPKNFSAVQSLSSPALGGTMIKDKLMHTKYQVAQVLKERDQIESAFTRAQQDKILEITKMTPQEIVNRAYQDTNFAKDLVQRFGKTPQALNALRSWMLDDILLAPQSFKLLTEDKNKVATFERVFGFGYVNKLRQISEIADTLKKNPTDIKWDLKGAPKDLLEQFVPGMSVPYATALARRPIVSAEQKFVIALSKTLTSTTANDYERRLKEILLDPKQINTYLDELKGVVETKKPLSWKSELGKLFHKMMDMGISPTGTSLKNNTVRGATVGATTAAQQKDD